MAADTDFSLLIYRLLGIATPDSRLLALSVAWGSRAGVGTQKRGTTRAGLRTTVVVPCRCGFASRARSHPDPDSEPTWPELLGAARGRDASWAARRAIVRWRTDRLSDRPSAVRVRPSVSPETRAGKGFPRWESREAPPRDGVGTPLRAHQDRNPVEVWSCLGWSLPRLHQFETSGFLDRRGSPRPPVAGSPSAAPARCGREATARGIGSTSTVNLVLRGDLTSKASPMRCVSSSWPPPSRHRE